GKIANRGVFTYGLLAGALPDFWLGLVLVYFFFYKFNFMPAPLGRLDPSTPRPNDVTGLLTIDSIISGNWADLVSTVSHLVLPVVTLVFVYSPVVLKMARSTVFEILDAPYVRFAHACGLPPRKILVHSALIAVGPIVTILSVVYGYLL